MSLSEQFQNSDSFIYANGLFFPTATALKMKNNNSDAK